MTEAIKPCRTCRDQGGCGACYGEGHNCDQCGGGNTCLDCGRAGDEEDEEDDFDFDAHFPMPPISEIHMVAMTPEALDKKEAEIEQLRARVEELEGEQADRSAPYKAARAAVDRWCADVLPGSPYGGIPALIRSLREHYEQERERLAVAAQAAEAEAAGLRARLERLEAVAVAARAKVVGAEADDALLLALKALEEGGNGL